MSWLLENWFGNKESLEKVREDVQDYLQTESYVGISGLEKPEESSNRIPSNELEMSLFGPWAGRLDEMDMDLLQFIHDQLPPVVRDEIGVIPFFNNVTEEGYLVLAFLRNATNRDIFMEKLPLVLTTVDGEVVARKTFDMIRFGGLADMSSRPYDFFFRWDEFTKVPEQEVLLLLSIDREKHQQSKRAEELLEIKNGLTEEEESLFKAEAAKAPTQGRVDLQVVGLTNVEEGGIKVIVSLGNGLGSRVEITEVPIIVQDQAGNLVARVNYGLKNLWVEAGQTRLYGFYIPEDSIQRENVDAHQCSAHIPDASEDSFIPQQPAPKGLIQ
ncbi:SLAP domain-containing protein [Brevibacillus dissolubilis]|uniref:SLAP domain-containing protein n=1 Tax=Brevibacillus dissolubilis TaxID=1844116 RepID=UPI001115CF43|nr:SLAP domain-containing protein [Brevibacillus dissolubilis]